MSGAFGTTAFPPWPAILFSYLEPISLILGAYGAIASPSTFITSQLPTHDPVAPILPAATILTYTLGSLFLVLAGYTLICTVLTNDAKVTKYYLLFAACGDIGHLAANYAGLESRAFWAWREWNGVMWANIAVTAFLFVNRLATLGGIYGEPGWAAIAKAKKA